MLVQPRRPRPEELQLLARVELAWRWPRHPQELRERRLLDPRPALQAREVGKIRPELIKEERSQAQQVRGDLSEPLERVQHAALQPPVRVALRDARQLVVQALGATVVLTEN